MSDIELSKQQVDDINKYKNIILKKDLQIKLKFIGFCLLLCSCNLYILLTYSEVIKNEIFLLGVMMLACNAGICLLMTLTIFKDGEKISSAPFSYSILTNDRILNKNFRFVKRSFQVKKYYMLIFDSDYKYVVDEIEMSGGIIPTMWIMNNVEYTTDNYNRFMLNKQL